MFFDMKNHLLYGTESFCKCAQNEDMALCMAYEAYLQGCRFIMATPPDEAFLRDAVNAEANPADITERFLALRNRIRRYMPQMGMELGCEISCTRDRLDTILHYLGTGRLPTLGNTRCVLVSFPDDVSREELWYCLDRLDRAGYSPVLSHAQRLQTLKYDIHEIRCLKGEAERGGQYRFRCLIQLDTLSLHFSERDRHWSEEMIRHGVVDLLGTDARNTFTQPPCIQEEIDSVRAICTPEYLEAITWRNGDSLFRTGA